MMILDPSITLLTRAARSGLPLAFKATAIDPAQQTIQSPVRELPGSAIRSVLLDADLRADPHGLILIGLQITGELDLADCTLSYPLRFVECDFDTLLPWSHIKGTWIELYKLVFHSCHSKAQSSMPSTCRIAGSPESAEAVSI